jgi:hypothetical protein
MELREQDKQPQQQRGYDSHVRTSRNLGSVSIASIALMPVFIGVKLRGAPVAPQKLPGR